MHSSEHIVHRSACRFFFFCFVAQPGCDSCQCLTNYSMRDEVYRVQDENKFCWTFCITPSSLHAATSRREPNRYSLYSGVPKTSQRILSHAPSMCVTFKAPASHKMPSRYSGSGFQAARAELSLVSVSHQCSPIEHAFRKQANSRRPRNIFL
jgi:hypothetical protein